MSVLIAPSILSADFGRLADDVREAVDAGADWIHVDVMDGHFVPNITIGPGVTRAVRAATDVPVDVHLMIERPGLYIDAFAEAGADVITVHQEACPHLHRTIQQIREAGVRAGVAINPATPVETLSEILDYVDLVLVMTVNPGFGGQAYLHSSTDKVARVRDSLAAAGRSDVDVEVDGGVDASTAPSAVNAGANVLVAGSAVFDHPEGITLAIGALRDAVTQGP
ncbi:MAG: ribulose-phosphate 3-epimerase [Gemmatimonadota bacterium]|nr:MAG: ribulose-phosphate 3-epimerase [Gemmatimonadota bacterium]